MMIFLIWAGEHQLALGILACVLISAMSYLWFMFDRSATFFEEMAKEIGKTQRHRRATEHSAFLTLNKMESDKISIEKRIVGASPILSEPYTINQAEEPAKT